MDEQTQKNIERLRLASQELLVQSSPDAGLSLDGMDQLFVAYDQQVRDTFEAAHVSLRQAANADEWAAGYEQVSADYLATVTSVASKAFAELNEALQPTRPEGVVDRETSDHLRHRRTFAQLAESTAIGCIQVLSKMIESLRV